MGRLPSPLDPRSVFGSLLEIKRKTLQPAEKLIPKKSNDSYLLEEK